jgi:hypothetical protein
MMPETMIISRVCQKQPVAKCHLGTHPAGALGQLDREDRGARKGPEGPFERLHSTDCSQNIRRIQMPGGPFVGSALGMDDCAPLTTG